MVVTNANIAQSCFFCVSDVCFSECCRTSQIIRVSVWVSQPNENGQQRRIWTNCVLPYHGHWFLSICSCRDERSRRKCSLIIMQKTSYIVLMNTFQQHGSRLSRSPAGILFMMVFYIVSLFSDSAQLPLSDPPLLSNWLPLFPFLCVGVFNYRSGVSCQPPSSSSCSASHTHFLPQHSTRS